MSSYLMHLGSACGWRALRHDQAHRPRRDVLCKRDRGGQITHNRSADPTDLMTILSASWSSEAPKSEVSVRQRYAIICAAFDCSRLAIHRT